jgi:hypothetical protein
VKNEKLCYPGHDWPDARDENRWYFLRHAVELEPGLKKELDDAGDNKARLKTWQKKWQLKLWAVRLLRNGYHPMSPVEVINVGCHDGDLRPLPHHGATLEWYPGNNVIHLGIFWPRVLQPPHFYYSPELESPGEFKRRVLERVTSAVDEHCNQVQEEAVRDGMKPVAIPRGAERHKHFEWLARQHILGEGPGAMAKREWRGNAAELSERFKRPRPLQWDQRPCDQEDDEKPIDRWKIEKAVKRLARYIDLDLRPPRRRRTV